MYDIIPRAVFAHKRVFKNPRAVARMERMLDAMHIPLSSVPVVDINDIDEIIKAAGSFEEKADRETVRIGHNHFRNAHLRIEAAPAFVFNTFTWDQEERPPIPAKYISPQARNLYRLLGGVGEDFAFSRRDLLTPKSQFICQGGWGIHTLYGCLHKCDYCTFSHIASIMLDIEEFCEHLGAMMERRPEQLLYRYDLLSDILAFEPEYGASELIAKTCAEHGKYVLLYTRSNNVEWLADFPYKEHAPINWTLSMETQARTIERDSPTLDQRIEAMRFCQEHGFTVRAGFSPIYPIKEWRKETTEMLEKLFDKVQPEVLRGWVLALMDAAEFEMMNDATDMDEGIMQRMREAAPELNGKHHAPFPVDVRAEIYSYYLKEIKRLSPETPMALCTENPGVWDLIEDEVPMARDSMFCCCGGLSAPGAWKTIKASQK